MSQSRQSTPKINFSRGLVTEAHELNFPEDATTDELNMELQRDGSRRRRRAISYENNYLDLALDYSAGDVAHTHRWLNAGSVQGLVFIVLQVNNLLHFFETGGDTVSTNKKTFTVDLEDFQSPFGDYVGDTKVNTASIRGRLVVVSPNINPFLIQYSPDTDTVSTEEITFRIRDFEWQGDRTTYDEPALITSLTNDDRRYDTRNCGWVAPPSGTDPYVTYVGARSQLPALTHSWFAGKNASDVFSVAEWEKVYSGSTLIENGHYVLDLWNQDRRTASGFIQATNYVEQSRFTAVTAYGGRLFYSGLSSEKYTNAVFFTQILDDFDKAGELLQQNDPTSEIVPDLLATDGGVIYLEGAYNIKRLHVLGPYILVFAENGVWQIRGIDGLFKATDYAVSKVSEVGLKYEDSFVSAQGRPYWWAIEGIFTLTTSEEQQVLSPVNLSLDTIQTFYEGITGRVECQGAYDRINSKVFWVYPSSDETTTGKLREVLIFDELRKGFIPWTVADSSAYILDVVPLEDDSVSSVDFTVVDQFGNTVVDSGGDTVTVTRYGQNYFSSTLKFLCRSKVGGITFAEFTGTDFLDWGEEEFDSYLVTSYDFMDNLTTKKTGVYVTTFLQATEITMALVNDQLKFTTPSSCLMSAVWDFKRTPSVLGEQIYKLKYVPIPSLPSLAERLGLSFDPEVDSLSGLLELIAAVLTADIGTSNTFTLDEFIYPETVVVSRTRLRGRGREVQLRFESDGTNDFHILGYDMITARNNSL